MPKQGGVNNLPVKYAARLLNKSEMWVRMGLRTGRLKYGDAVLNDNGNWSYCIYKTEFAKALGLTAEMLDQQIEEMHLSKIRNEFCCL